MPTILTRKAIPVHHTATSGAAWSAADNVKNLSNKDGAAVYREAFAWVDPDKDADTKGAYRFPHHLISADGKVGSASTKACIAGIAVLNGGRGGADIPDDDRQGVYNHLAAHLKDADIEPPELKSMDSHLPDYLRRARERLGLDVEFRSAPLEYRDMLADASAAAGGDDADAPPADSPGGFLGYLVRWDVEDSYGTQFERGSFSEGGLDSDPYGYLWMHDPWEPVGTFRGVEDDTGLLITGAYDPTPEGQRARARAKSGSAAELSVGFVRLADELIDGDEWKYRIVKARLVEGSQITARMAAQPGAGLMSVRQREAADSERRRAEEAAAEAERSAAALTRRRRIVAARTRIAVPLAVR